MLKIVKNTQKNSLSEKPGKKANTSRYYNYFGDKINLLEFKYIITSFMGVFARKTTSNNPTSHKNHPKYQTIQQKNVCAIAKKRF
jgi:hypothetical protein